MQIMLNHHKIVLKIQKMIDIVVKKKPSDFRLMTYVPIADTIAYCIISLDVKIGKGILNKDDVQFILLFIFKEITSQYRGVQDGYFTCICRIKEFFFQK